MLRTPFGEWVLERARKESDARVREAALSEEGILLAIECFRNDELEEPTVTLRTDSWSNLFRTHGDSRTRIRLMRNILVCIYSYYVVKVTVHE